MEKGKLDVDMEIREQLLEPFVAATDTALREMAGVDALVHNVFRQAVPESVGDACAVVKITAARDGFLILRFPAQTATAISRRILTGVIEEPDENLVRDCVGEIANVIAGQAKALLAGSAYQFTFSVPQVLSAASQFKSPPGFESFVITFQSQMGKFELLLFLSPTS